MEYPQIVDDIEERRLDKVLTWLNADGDPNLGIREGKHPLIADVLDELYEDPNDPALHQLLERFIKKGARVNFSENNHFVPLAEAIQAKSIKAVELLLAHQADPNVVVYPGLYPNYTPLLLAVEYNDAEAVKLLVKATDPELIHYVGGVQVATALGTACQILNLTIIEELLQCGANPYFVEWDHAYAHSIELIPSDISHEQNEELLALMARFNQHKQED